MPLSGEDRVAAGDPTVPGVARPVALPQVGLGLDDPRHQALAVEPPHDVAAEQLGGDLLAGTAVERDRQCLHGRPRDYLSGPEESFSMLI